MIASVQKALKILNLFDSQHPELGVTEIADALDLHKSTTSTLVQTLEDSGYLARNPDTRKYRLGIKIVERAFALLDQLEIRTIAMPYLESLRDWSEESVNLAIHEGNEVVYVARLLSSHVLGMRSEVGRREQVHSTALGKAILAAMPEDEARAVLESYPLTARTEHTLTTAPAILADLRATRKRGYALDDEENEIGARCTAAPILDHTGRPVAAISISVPLPRIPTDRIDHFGQQVAETAGEISRMLGYREG